MRIADVSSNNPHPLNFRAMQAAGISGLMVKATESTTYVDGFFEPDYFGALDAGMVPGAYHFDHWLESVTDQLTFFSHHYGRRNGDLAPWWDLENYRDRTGRWRTLGVDLPWPEVAKRCETVKWCLTVAYGDSVIYCSRDTAANLRPFGFRPEIDLCVAQGATGPIMGARIMQFPPVSIPGVAGLTDWNAS